MYQLDDESLQILSTYESRGLVTVVHWSAKQLTGFTELPSHELKPPKTEDSPSSTGMFVRQHLKAACRGLTSQLCLSRIFFLE